MKIPFFELKIYLKFLFGGRLIFGPDIASLFLSSFLIVSPAMAFCVKILSIIRHPLSENKDAVPWYPDVFFLFITSSRDPGIVPRNKKPPECDETIEIDTPSVEWVNGRTPHLKLPRTKDVLVNGHTIKVKFCDTCLLYRPPRVSHCSICNNCVLRFDHHCPWIGQCIGIRNYRFFYMFITTSTILCIYVFAFSWYNIFHRQGSVWKAISSDYVSDVLIVYCFIAFWFVGGLTFFHFYLICTNQNNFRAIVEEDEVTVAEPSNHSPADGITSSKEKTDFEMGNEFGENSSPNLPDILRSLEFDDIDENIKDREASERSYSDQLVPLEPDLKEEKCDGMISEQTKASAQA
ncbi:UNVERIFIED_CONTAM: putative protein S-acyltransferase 4 [Sesamum calycinum]|uniref:S-acyltransferase n=1 Tax=Sesamum calycinum TaxID=2727403 RepID=A0AAW2RU16_9LAMI